MKSLLCIFFLFLSFSSLFALDVEKKVYVVCFGGHNENKTTTEVEEIHYSYLLSAKEVKEEARSSLLYSYTHGLNGFAALLTEFEASKLSALEEVIHVVESHPMTYSLHTTKSWTLLGLKELNTEEVFVEDRFKTGKDFLLKANYGKNVIVGVIDTGVWPESDSFNDEGMDPIPRSWERKCLVDRASDSTFSCNKKIIGAKYYLKDFEIKYGRLDLSYNKRSPRDMNGHGTHIASIVSGRQVKDVAFREDFAFGNASGGAPKTRLAIYKVCWEVEDESSSPKNDCTTGDILAGINDAILDEVHVINFSIGPPAKASYDDDLISIALLRATKKGIVVVCSAGNSGPKPATVANLAPWVITVGFSSNDRMFLAPLELGDGTRIKGQTVDSSELLDMTSLVYAGFVQNIDHSQSAAGFCDSGSLDPTLAKGKIVFCKSISYTKKTEAIKEVIRVGGVGVIFGNIDNMDGETPLHSHRLPAISLTTKDSISVFKYINFAGNVANASIGRAVTTRNYKPSPSIMAPSSRGPNPMDRHILKPDLIAPGLNILAAWNNHFVIGYHKIVKYNIKSGASMATPHVTAVISLLRAVYPYWSSAAIRSAIMTSSSTHNNANSWITDYDGSSATPFASGFGYLKPAKAVDPGLVYDASLEDYLTYLCNLELESTVLSVDAGFLCPEESAPSYHFNYPSLAISNIIDNVKVRRTVTNVGDPQSTYKFIAMAPLGFIVESTPNVLSFNSYGEKQSFTITVTKDGNIKGETNKKGKHSFGYYIWKYKSHRVRSPIVIFVE